MPVDKQLCGNEMFDSRRCEYFELLSSTCKQITCDQSGKAEYMVAVKVCNENLVNAVFRNVEVNHLKLRPFTTIYKKVKIING